MATTKILRKIVHIDEDKCNGCGACVPNCVEGALKIVNGKARLISEQYCDGLGACLGKCPQDAITIEERLSDEFSEEAVEKLHEEAITSHSHSCPGVAVQQFNHHTEEVLPCGCPSASVKQFTQEENETVPASQKSMLTHWPVQLTLVPPGAPFLRNADILLTADCVPVAYGDYQQLVANHAVLVACPKLDDVEAHLQKLTQILSVASPRSITIAHMEVPCCFGLMQLIREAMRRSGKNIPVKEMTIGVKGDVLE